MTILEYIVQSKRSQFPQATAAILKAPASSRLRTPDKFENPFANALSKPEVSIIGEIKPSSPSAGKLLEPARLPEILRLYKQHCAAISVLTDDKYFNGSFNLLAEVKQATGLPVLCKDFIVSNEQILLAKKHGADAVLLIAKILSDDELISLFNAALDAELCPVVEINNLSDLQAIAELPTQVVLINNRNLDTMQIDLNTTSLLASRLKNDPIVISASGISTKEDVEKLLPSANNFLIGTSLMKSEDPAALLSGLNSCGRTHNSAATPKSFQSVDAPKIKICGITNAADANMAIEAGAEFIGLIFVPSSKRQVSIEEARAVVDAVKNRAKTVGVFQNQSIESVNRIADQLDLDLVQLHGDEDSAFINACVKPVIKAFEYPFKANSNQRLLELSNANYFLFDLNKNSDAEESAERFQKLASSLAPLRSKLPPFFLAGKLAADNVQQASQAVRPFALDVASGVEESPKNKSVTLTKQFCNLAKSR